MPKARGNGEGGIFKAKDGRWVARLSLGYGPDGRMRRKEFRVATKAEALARLRDAQHQLAEGIQPTPERLTVGTFLADWFENSVRPRLRGRTVESYQSIIAKHLRPDIGRIALARLGPADVQRYMNKKLAEGQSARSVQYHRAILRTALNQALKWGLVPRNVASLVDVPRVRRAEVKPLNLDQARALLEAVRGDRLEALYTVALAIGLRLGEALGLHWADVDLDAGTLTVRITLQRIAGKLALDETKNERSRRTIHLPEVAVAALRSHKIRQLEERLHAGSLWQDHGLVFTTHSGGPIAKENFRRPWARLLETAGLPRIRFHDLRHSCASLLHAQGADARLIMEILGHSQIATTLDIYTHLFREAGRGAAARLDAALSPDTDGRSDVAAR